MAFFAGFPNQNVFPDVMAFLTRFRIPHDGPTSAGADERLAVGSERNGMNGASVIFQRVRLGPAPL